MYSEADHKSVRCFQRSTVYGENLHVTVYGENLQVSTVLPDHKLVRCFPELLCHQQQLKCAGICFQRGLKQQL